MPEQRIYEILTIGSIIGLTLLASILFSQEILLWFSYALTLLFLYLVWRAIRAIERVAESLESK